MEKRFTIDDKDYLIKIKSDDLSAAKRIHAKTFRKALEDGAILRRGLTKYMKEQNIWDDEKEAEYKDILKRIAKLESELSTGVVDGRTMKVSEGKEKALDLTRTRGELQSLISERTSLDVNTAEGQADNERFNYLVSRCVYDYDTQTPVFESLEDYYSRGSDELSVKLASKLANLMYGVDENHEDNYIENKFLKRFKMIDEEGNFIDKEGHAVDVEGCRVNEEGYRIDENGTKLDRYNNVLGDIETATFEEDV